jgi:4-aminobutyrate aminotransferase/(S)-3-amino-2-methylpropionate transaminase
MKRNEDLGRRRAAAVARGVASAQALYAARAENGELWDVEGRRYVDFSSGIAVLNTGHRHPRIVAAVEAQLKAFTHTCFTVTPYEGYVELCERINALLPIAGAKKAALFTTGAEAIENAVKIARAHTKRPAVIACGGGFHGRTFMAMALTGKVAPYKQGFGPLPGDVYHVPFPIAYHGVSVADSLAAIEELFHADLEPGRVAALIVEAVQGEGGFYIAPPDYLKSLRALCDQHGIVLIADEVQTGFGRTGRWFGIEHSGVEPDLVTLAKSLGGGFPLSGVAGKAAIMDAASPGGLGGTYAGSPIACAAALAVLDTIAAEGLLERAVQQGLQLKAGLAALKHRHALEAIGEIRGLGAMVAMELVEAGDAQRPDAALTKAIVQASAARGLILLSCGVRSNVIRFLAPLTASEALIDEGLGILEQAFLACAAPPVARAAAG